MQKPELEPKEFEIEELDRPRRVRVRRALELTDYKLMDLPTLYWRVRWSDFKSLSVLPTITNYLERMHTAISDGDSLFLYGGDSVSQLAAYIAKLARSYSYSVMWARAIDAQDNLHERKIWDSEEGSFLERYRTVDLLVIDGFGDEVEAVGRTGRNRVKDLIEYRLAWCRTTVITTTRSVAELDVFYGRGYASKLVDSLSVIGMDGGVS